METKLWYTAPAKNWNEALPLGNGSLGGMVFGGVDAERIALNLDTLWSGTPKNKTPADLAGYYRQAAALALQNDYAAAQAMLEEHLCGSFTEGYLPMGDLLLENLRPGPVTGYRRTLDLSTGVAGVEYRQGGAAFTRRCFASHPDNALVFHLTANKPAISTALRLTSQLRGAAKVVDGQLLYLGECPTHVAPSYLNDPDPVRYEEGRHGIGFCFGIALVTDGHATLADGCITVQNATTLTVLLAANDSFCGYNADPFDPARRYLAACTTHLQQLCGQGFAALYQRHLDDYQPLEQCCRFTLEARHHNSALPTDERLHRFESDPSDRGLYELLFRYGRYLLFSSSRPGTQAANLQGIWNAALRPPWSANYTLNINTEMNYWPVYMANLAPCAEPLISLVGDLAESGRAAAQNLYGAKGWVCHHNTDLWRAANPVGEHQPGCACYGFWPMSAAWLCRTVYEYYEYTLDTAYLKDTALPLMKGAAEFLLSVLQKDENGQLIFCPATSPENNFLLGGKPLSVSKSSAMSQGITWDLLNSCRHACEITGDTAFAQKITPVLENLRPLQIGRDGRILEWHEEAQEAEVHHRHLSHLYALHPGHQITPAHTPALAAACRQSLNTRGDAGTGWSLAWKINQWARLGDGARAGKLLEQQLHAVASTVVETAAGGGTYPNLFCAHPPFQIDGNFGAVSGMVEMLLQSDESGLTLLPALPPTWPNGALEGACARGGYTVSLRWGGGKLQQATITAQTDTTCHLRWPGGERLLPLTAGTPCALTF